MRVILIAKGGIGIFGPLVFCFFLSLALTPIVKTLALKTGAVDFPNHRKVHSNIMPRLGGIAIFFSFVCGLIVYRPNVFFIPPFLMGSFLIALTGLLDDFFQLPARVKLIGQIVSTFPLIFGGMAIDFIMIPFTGPVYFGLFSIPVTIIWIVGITNAINLIDGLDGLAAGVSAIAIMTITFIAFQKGNMLTVTIGLLAIGSIAGFLIYNFHPAKIFMGDSGALFLGYLIAVLSLMGFKSVTFFSYIIPIIILGVPLSDTIFAIIRRIVHKQPIAVADKSHLHHVLLKRGFTHRQAVLAIYMMAAMFGLIAIIFSQATVWGAILIIAIVLLFLELLAEFTGIISKDYRPLLKMVKNLEAKNKMTS